jgi:hypothetical protein
MKKYINITKETQLMNLHYYGSKMKIDMLGTKQKEWNAGNVKAH